MLLDPYMLCRGSSSSEGGWSDAAEAPKPSLDHEVSIFQRLLVQGQSPYIIGFYGELEIPGHLGISLERAHQSLKDYIEGKQNNVTRADQLRIALELGEGARWINQQKVYHNDLKPANVLLTSAGTVKIADFGLASFDQPAPGQGTPIYMAPEFLRYRTTVVDINEQQLSPQSHRSSMLLAKKEVAGDGKLGAGDVWGLGATVFELVHRKKLIRPIAEKVKKADYVLFALDFESDLPEWKRQNKFPIDEAFISFFDHTLAKRSARAGADKAVEDLRAVFESEEKREGAAAASRPYATPAPNPLALPLPSHPIPATAVAQRHLLGAKAPQLFTANRPPAQHLPSRLAVVSPIVAASSSPLPPQHFPVTRTTRSSAKDAQADGHGDSRSGQSVSLDAEVEEAGSGSTEDEDDRASSSIVEYAMPVLEEQMNEEEDEEEDKEEYSVGGEEEQSSEAAPSPLALRKPVDVKGKGKARAPLTPITNQHRITRSRSSDPSTLPSIATPLPHPHRAPVSPSPSASPASPPMPAPSFEFNYNDRRTWPLFDYRGFLIVYADHQRPPVKHRAQELLYAIVGDEEGLFAHLGDSFVVLTTSELEDLWIILASYPDWATAEDEARLEVVLMQGDTKAVTAVERCMDRNKYVCALCAFPDEFFATGHGQTVVRQVATRHVRLPPSSKNKDPPHGRKNGVVLVRDIGEEPFVAMRKKGRRGRAM